MFMDYQTIKVHFQKPFCFVQFHRPDANNTINDRLIRECHTALSICEDTETTVVVLEGLPDVFCFGFDFKEVLSAQAMGSGEKGPEPLYDLWLRLATGPFVTVANIRGKVNAGGMGFVAASDIAVADQTAQFSLSELLFGLMPACVLPFLIRRMGFQRAHYMTLMTAPISAQEAYAWSLVDAYEPDSEMLLRKHLLRLRRLSKEAVIRYKRYANELNDSINRLKPLALSANREQFSDESNLQAISRYLEQGLLPWEDEAKSRLNQ
jgi:polyketide biosynthesis enoyl-CoA hydratase PksH